MSQNGGAWGEGVAVPQTFLSCPTGSKELVQLRKSA